MTKEEYEEAFEDAIRDAEDDFDDIIETAETAANVTRPHNPFFADKCQDVANAVRACRDYLISQRVGRN